jgi:hypothetical protein
VNFELFCKKLRPTYLPIVEITPNLGPIFQTFFPGKIPGKIPRKIPPPQKKTLLEKIRIFCGRKMFRKIIFPTNSTEFSTENHFPRKKMYKKLAAGHTE